MHIDSVLYTANAASIHFMMRYLAALISACAFLPGVFSILADEAFHVDYHNALLGIPQQHSTFFHRPQSSSSASLLYTVSNKHVVGAINPKDGSLVWRQALTDLDDTLDVKSYLVAAEGTGNVVSAVGNTVSAWDALTGQLVWQHTGIKSQQTVSLASLATESIDDTLVVLKDEHATVQRLEASSGKVRWEFTDTRYDNRAKPHSIELTSI